MSDIEKTPNYPVIIRRVKKGEGMQRTLSVSSFCQAEVPEDGFVITAHVGQKLMGTPVYVRDIDLKNLEHLNHDEEVVVDPWENYNNA